MLYSLIIFILPITNCFGSDRGLALSLLSRVLRLGLSACFVPAVACTSAWAVGLLRPCCRVHFGSDRGLASSLLLRVLRLGSLARFVLAVRVLRLGLLTYFVFAVVCTSARSNFGYSMYPRPRYMFLFAQGLLCGFASMPLGRLGNAL